MALVRCEECGEKISSQAQACPKCGAPRATPPPLPAPQKRKPLGCGSAIVIVLVVLVAATMMAPKPPPASRQDAGIQIPSDPSATYYVLETSGPKTARIIVTKRVGKETGFSKRVYNCENGTVKYLGTGDTLSEMQASKPDAEMSPIVNGSIASYIGGIACR